MWGKTIPKVVLTGKCDDCGLGLKHAHTSSSIKSQGH